MTSTVVIRAKYDDDAKVWYVDHSDLSGVHAEGTTFDELCGKLSDVVRDVVEANSGKPITSDILIEIVAHASTRDLIYFTACHTGRDRPAR
jgi:hypothetical protein